MNPLVHAKQIYRSPAIFDPDALTEIIGQKKVLITFSADPDQEWGYVELSHQALRGQNICHLATPLEPLVANLPPKWRPVSDKKILRQLPKFLNSQGLRQLLLWYYENVRIVLASIGKEQAEAYALEGSLKSYEHEITSFYLKDLNPDSDNPKEQLLQRRDLLRMEAAFIEPLLGIIKGTEPLLERHQELFGFNQAAKLLHMFLCDQTNLERDPDWILNQVILQLLAKHFGAIFWVSSLRGWERAHLAYALALAVEEIGDNKMAMLAFQWPMGREELARRCQKILQMVCAPLGANQARKEGFSYSNPIIEELLGPGDHSELIRELTVA